MVKGYCDNSIIGRTLEKLLRKGIDCIKIIPSKHKFDGTSYLALGGDEYGEPYSIEKFIEICHSVQTENMEIEPKTMRGRDIKLQRVLKGLKAIPKYKGVKLRIEDYKLYNILEVKYAFCEIGAKSSQKTDLSYLKPLG